MKVKINFLDIMTVVIFLWYINPMSTDFLNWTIFGVMAFIWVVLAYCQRPALFTRIVGNPGFLLFLLFEVLLIIYDIFGHADFYFQSFSVPFSFLVGQYYLSAKSKKSCKGIFAISTVYLVLIALITIKDLFVYPNMSRLLAGGSSDAARVFASPFHGGYTFVYSMVLFALSSVVFLLSSQKYATKKGTLLNIFIFGMTCILAFMSQYTTAVLLIAVGVCFTIIFVLESKNVKVLSMILILVLCLIFWGGFLPIILASIADMCPAGEMKDHFMQLSLVVARDNQSIDDVRRMQIFKESLEMFVSSPVWGMGRSHNHQEVIDALAQYGLLGAIPYFTGLFMMCRSTLRVFRTSAERRQLFVPMVIFAALLFLNTAGDGLFYLLLFALIPLKIVSERKENN